MSKNSISDFKFRSCDIEKVWADCFGGSLKGFKIMVKKGDDPVFKTPEYEVVHLSPTKVEMAVLMYLHKHPDHVARPKPRGSLLWFCV